MASIKVKRGTRAQIDAAAGVNGLAAGEPYLIEDEARLAVGTAANSYQAMAKEGEQSVPSITVGPTAPTSPQSGDLWVDTN